MAGLMRALRRMEAATIMYRRAVDVHAALGVAFKESVTALYDFAEHLRQTDDLENGLRVATQAVAESRRVTGIEALGGRAHIALSRIQATLGKTQAAYDSSQAAVRLLEQSEGKAHSDTLLAKGWVASHCVTLGRLAEAERLLTDTIFEKERLGETGDASYLNLLLDLYTVQVRKNDHGAIDTFQKATEVYRGSVGPKYERAAQLHERLPTYLVSDQNPDHEAFFKALFSGETGLAKRLLDKDDSLVNFVDTSGWTVLQWGVFFDLNEIVANLLSRGADLSHGVGTDLPAIYVACRWGQRRVLATLSRSDADFEVETGDGSRPIHGAVRSGDQLTVDMVLAKKARLDVTNKRGWTALHEAAYSGDRKLLLLLISKGGEINLQAGTHRESPLHAAILGGCVATAEILILNTADINAAKADGVTPLRLAEQLGRGDIESMIKAQFDNQEDEVAEAEVEVAEVEDEVEDEEKPSPEPEDDGAQ